MGIVTRRILFPGRLQPSEDAAWQRHQNLRDRVEGVGDVFVDRKVLRLASVSYRLSIAAILCKHEQLNLTTPRSPPRSFPNSKLHHRTRLIPLKFLPPLVSNRCAMLHCLPKQPFTFRPRLYPKSPPNRSVTHQPRSKCSRRSWRYCSALFICRFSLLFVMF